LADSSDKVPDDISHHEARLLTTMASLGVVMMEMATAVPARLLLLTTTASRGTVMMKMATAITTLAWLSTGEVVLQV